MLQFWENPDGIANLVSLIELVKDGPPSPCWTKKGSQQWAVVVPVILKCGHRADVKCGHRTDMGVMILCGHRAIVTFTNLIGRHEYATWKQSRRE